MGDRAPFFGIAETNPKIEPAALKNSVARTLACELSLQPCQSCPPTASASASEGRRQTGALVVLGSPMQRGVLSAVRWFVPELRDVFALDSLESAVGRALTALEAKGVVAPGPTDAILRYIMQRPSRAPFSIRSES